MKNIISTSLLAILPSIGFSAINWGTNATTTSFNSDGTTALVASRDDAVGFFVQLLWVGNNGVVDAIDPANANGQGGDDVVVDVAWFGASTLSPVSGRLVTQSDAHVPGRTYFVRAWNAPTPNPQGTATTGFSLADGNESQAAPLLTATFYGNATPITTDPAGQAVDNVAYNFSVVTNIPVSVIPEPTTAGLLGMGILGVVSFLRKKRG